MVMYMGVVVVMMFYIAFIIGLSAPMLAVLGVIAVLNTREVHSYAPLAVIVILTPAVAFP